MRYGRSPEERAGGKALVPFRVKGRLHGGRLFLASFAIALSALVASVSLLGGTAAPALAAGCPNEAIRAEQGEAALALPDCRAYEMVSESQSAPRATQYAASVSGDRFTYNSFNPFPGQQNQTLSYVATRGANGWSSSLPAPGQNGANTTDLIACSPAFTVTPEIDHVLLADGVRALGGASETEGEECLGDEPPLVSGEPRGVMNIFRTDPAGSSYELVDQTPAGAEEQDSFLQAFTPDAKVVVFTNTAALTPNAPPLTESGASVEERIYIWANGAVHYLAYLPDGTPTVGRLEDGGRSGGGSTNITTIMNTMSSDGESVVFEHETKIYLRVHALREQSAVSGGVCTEPSKACTVPIDVSEEGPSEVGGFRERVNRHFEYATPDGSRIFFMDDRKLTPDSTAAVPVKDKFGQLSNGKSDLYEYAVGTGVTKDLTVNVAEPADVRGFVGGEPDADNLYFVATGDLTGSQQNSQGATAAPRIKGTGNLIGGLRITGDLTEGSATVTSVSIEEGEGEVHPGQELEGELAFGAGGEEHLGIAEGTRIVSCSPNCAEPTELTLSIPATETLSETRISVLGEFKVTGVNTTSGAFRVGMRIEATGVKHSGITGDEIKAVGPGTLTLSGRAGGSGTAEIVGSEPNLYVLHEGHISYIATLGFFGSEAGFGSGDGGIWQEFGETQNTGALGGRVSANGRFLAFSTAQSITGFDNTPAEPGDCNEACQEDFLYAADSGELTCVSCSPSGEAPVAPTRLFGTVESMGGGVESPAYLPRNVSDSGEVFFETDNPLLPSDGNGQSDVYEYDAGQLSLISSGEDSGPSEFFDASVDGSNVFFTTGQGLVNRDGDQGTSVYDARVGGGYSEPPPLPGCESEACRGASTSKAAEIAAGTPSFTGPGNKVQKPTRDCTPISNEAKKLSKQAKRLSRQAAKASGPKAAKLKRKSAKLAKQGKKASKRAKTCRRSNQGGGK